jgi:hypothetical protein
VSSNRKLRRAQQSRGVQKKTAARAPSREDLRRQTALQRFKTPGSDRLWVALLGWDTPRAERMWLAQSVNDAAQGEHTAGALTAFGTRSAAGEKLDESSFETAIGLWKSSGDDYQPGEPSPKWEYLANLCGKLGLGGPTADDLSGDWEAWTSMSLAAPPRKLLMDSLAQTEQIAMALEEITHSDNAAAVANVTRALWQALAYGDETTFKRVRGWAEDWLSSLSKG